MRKGTKNDEELYHNCWLNKWKCNRAYPKQWVQFYFFTSFFTKNNIDYK